MKKLFAMLLCACLLLTGAALADVLGTYPVEGAPVTLTGWGILAGSSMVDNFNDNPAFQELEKITGVHIEWECVTEDGAAEKRALRIAKGDLPDIFFRAALTDEEVASLASAGQLLDLSGMIEEYAPNFNALMQRDETIRLAITDSTGAIYALPQVTTNSLTTHMIINTRWLSNLNLEIPQTVDELYEVLKAFKEQDANGNGDPTDEIPMSANGLDQLNILMHAFKVYPDNYYGMFVYPGTSEVKNSYISDDLKEAFRYLKKLYDEGLLDPETFSQDGDTYTAKGTADRLGYLTVAGAFVNVGNDLHWDYQGLAPFPDNEGNRLMNKRASCGGNHFAITSGCKNPEAALRYVDYLYSEEGTTLAWMGVEGVSWEWIDDTHTTWHWLKPDDLTMNQFRHSYAIQGGVGYPSAHPIWFESKMWDRQEDPIEASLDTDRFRKPATDCGVLLWPTIKWSVEDNETLSFILPDCQTYYKASAVDFITGVRDIDADWDSYIETLKGMGIEEAISMCQGAYDNYMAQISK